MISGRRPRHRHTAPPNRRPRTRLRARSRLAVLSAAVPVGLLACGAVVWHSSSAAFTATTGTDGQGNSWQTGIVKLRDDDNQNALFTVGNLVPGSSGYKCITVTYEGSVATAPTGVRLYGKAQTVTPDLAAALQITVEMSTTALTPVANGGCPSAFATSHVTYDTVSSSVFPVDYATGIGHPTNSSLGDWVPSSTDLSRTYKIAYKLPPDPFPSNQTRTDGIQGKSLTMTFTWEVQSDTPGT